MHVNAEELVDIAEGTRPESSAPHLATCEPCRAQLHELRAMMSEVGGVGVPEPSPLFWDHLSRRVSEAVAAEESADAKPRRWTERLMAARAYALVTVAAAVLIAVAVSSRVQAPAPLEPPVSMTVVAPPPAYAVADASATAVLLDDAALQDDPSLMLVASLSDGVDYDTAREAGLAPRGSAEHAVTHMNDAELRELRRLLTEELARSGA
jgi:hypothetical protein